MILLTVGIVLAWIAGTYTLLIVMQDHEATVGDIFVAMFWPIALPLLGVYTFLALLYLNTIGRLFR